MRPESVEFIPKVLEEGVLYVSEKYKTASHLCACGCGTKIVTPLHETEYSLKRQGNLVTLHPSIGNWSHPCRSHYLIINSHVVWAGDMSAEAIQMGRARDEAAKDAYFVKMRWPWHRRTLIWLRDALTIVVRMAANLLRRR